MSLRLSSIEIPSPRLVDEAPVRFNAGNSCELTAWAMFQIAGCVLLPNAETSLETASVSIVYIV